MSKARQLADLGNVYDDGALSNRNMVVNGGMTVNQRGNSTTQIATDKQTLRDITDDARIAAATTPDELKALDLATLLGE